MTFEKRRMAFGNRLRHLREESGLTGKQLAEQLGWPPSKVSKIENGRQTPTDSDLTLWCRATGAAEPVAAELHDTLLDLRLEQTTRRSRAARRHDRRRYLPPESTARRIRVVDVGVVPGLVQIPAYARQVLALHDELQGIDQDIEQVVAARIASQTVLYDTTRSIEVLVAEAALRYPVVPPDVMVAQLDRLMSLIGLRSLRLGVLPLDHRMPWMPLHGYWIVDETVLVENVTADVHITDPDEVAVYDALTDRFWEVAVEGDEARVLLARIAADHTG